MPKLVPLKDWATAEYGEAAPDIQTLRRWAREGRIQPLPQRHGRSYFVDPAARYQPPRRGRSLMERAFGQKAGHG